MPSQMVADGPYAKTKIKDATDFVVQQYIQEENAAKMPAPVAPKENQKQKQIVEETKQRQIAEPTKQQTMTEKLIFTDFTKDQSK